LEAIGNPRLVRNSTGKPQAIPKKTNEHNNTQGHITHTYTQHAHIIVPLEQGKLETIRRRDPTRHVPLDTGHIIFDIVL
jgi:hypothetical protein